MGDKTKGKRNSHKRNYSAVIMIKNLTLLGVDQNAFLFVSNAISSIAVWYYYKIIIVKRNNDLLFPCNVAFRQNHNAILGRKVITKSWYYPNKVLYRTDTQCGGGGGH